MTRSTRERLPVAAALGLALRIQIGPREISTLINLQNASRWPGSIGGSPIAPQVHTALDRLGSQRRPGSSARTRSPASRTASLGVASWHSAERIAVHVGSAGVVRLAASIATAAATGWRSVLAGSACA